MCHKISREFINAAILVISFLYGIGRGKLKNPLLQGTTIAFFMVLLVACAAPLATPATIQATSTPVPPAPTLEPPTTTPAPESSDKDSIEKGQITSQALADNLVGDPATRDFLVYLPLGYKTSDKRYPVVYVLHWYTGDEWTFTLMTLDLDEMIAKGEAQEMILVFVDASNKFGGSMYLSSPTIGDYESYIVRELVDHIDANYRTLPARESRGVTGCSMGGGGSIHLALKYPEVFSVAAAVSGTYDYEQDPAWDRVKKYFWRTPEDFEDFSTLNLDARWLIAIAAGAASNPDKPPFYLDMPFEEVDGEVQIVPDVWEKVNAVSPGHDVPGYLDQPVRLRGLMIYHGEHDGFAPVEPVRDFDKNLTEQGVEHEYLEVNGNHCNLDNAPVLQFMSDHLDS